ncbi:hypothetical protein [Candidatus Competibacter denitrificans]|nr:hypothetical protein [Candidatus Competibacter denitrificans]
MPKHWIEQCRGQRLMQMQMTASGSPGGRAHRCPLQRLALRHPRPTPPQRRTRFQKGRDLSQRARFSLLSGPVLAALLVAVAGCASGPRESDLLPDEGPTTLETYERHLSGQAALPHAERTSPARTGSERDGPAGSEDTQPMQRAVPRETTVPLNAPTPGAIRVAWRGAEAAALGDAASSGSLAALGALQQDFQRLPNPEIVGYVYPHLSGDLPVPGYYTAFPLREGLYYARPGEGLYSGVAP